jgi:hypothetical protein
LIDNDRGFEMRQLIPVLALVAFSTGCSSVNNTVKNSGDSANENAKTQMNNARTLPTEEKAFVKAIKDYDKKSIIAELGEPAKADDVKVKGTNKIAASIWHYHFVNTDENGKYFETTELDFIDDKVVQVVFLNNDGSEEEKNDGLTYDLPENKPN